MNFQKNNAILYPAQLGSHSNALASLNTGAGSGSVMEDLNTQGQSPSNQQKSQNASILFPPPGKKWYCKFGREIFGRILGELRGAESIVYNKVFEININL